MTLDVVPEPLQSPPPHVGYHAKFDCRWSNGSSVRVRRYLLRALGFVLRVQFFEAGQTKPTLYRRYSETSIVGAEFSSF